MALFSLCFLLKKMYRPRKTVKLVLDRLSIYSSRLLHDLLYKTKIYKMYNILNLIKDVLRLCNKSSFVYTIINKSNSQVVE